MDFESLAGWTATHGSHALDGTNKKTGSYSLAITSPVGSYGQSQLNLGSDPAYQWDFSNTDWFRLWFYTTAAEADIASIYIYFLDSTGTKTATLLCYRRTGWNQVTWKKSDMSLAGGFSWSEKVRYLRLRVTPTAGVSITVSFDSFYAGLNLQPVILIQFDDANESTYTKAFLLGMQPHNIPGTFYVRTGYIDQPGSITSAQLLALQSAGWTVANHTRDHTDLAAADYSGALTAMNNGKADLVGIGITQNPNHLAYPGGAYDADAIQAAIDAGMLTGRLASATDADTKYQRWIPYTHPYQIPLAYQATASDSLATATAKVDDVIAQKRVGIMLFHNLHDSGPTGYNWYTDRFIALCEYIGSKRLPCLTMQQLYQLHTGPVKARVSR